MSPTPEAVTGAVVLFGLLAALCWGTADFTGGLASRRVDSFVTVLVSQVIGCVAAVLFALTLQERLPSSADAAWAAAAGLAGSIALAAFYRGLATGRIGVVAPVAGVLAAAVPVAAGALLEGAPGPVRLAGFGAGFAAVALVSGGGGKGRSGLSLAVFAGLGFGLFYVLIDRVSDGLVFWPLAIARVASVGLMVLIVVTRRIAFRPPRGVAPLLIAAGVLDLLGNAFFVVAAQTGRLDVAGVLSSLYPVATVALAAIVLGERIRPVQGVGIALACAATVLIGGG
ncbi:MAG: EamA family transporter [Chloroflexota bacterium]